MSIPRTIRRAARPTTSASRRRARHRQRDGATRQSPRPPRPPTWTSGARSAQVTVGFSAAVFGSAIEVYLSRREACRTCHGAPPATGCPACGEEGTELVETMVEVTVPPGTHTGSQARVLQAGDIGPRAGPPEDRRGAPGPAGDLVVEFTVSPIAGVVMQGQDLVYDLPIDVIDAILGSQHQMRLLDGPALVVAAPGCSPGGRLRIPGRGVPAHTAGRGDAYAELRFVMRTHLSGAERLALESVRKPRPPGY